MYSIACKRGFVRLVINSGDHDARITKSGVFFRKYKIDELPQLFNILKDKNHFARKTKIASFLIQRGFESNLVWDKIRELSDK